MRTSSRLNKGIPPIRFPEASTSRTLPRDADNQSVRSSRSKKSSSTVRRQEIEIDANSQLLDIERKLADKEMQCKLAERKVVTLQKQIDRVQEGNDDEKEKLLRDLENQKADAEDEADVHRIELEAMNRTSRSEVSLIQQKMILELEKTDSDDDFDANSVLPDEAIRRTSNWIGNLGHPPPPTTTLPRITTDATRSQVLPEVKQDNKNPAIYVHQRSSPTASFDLSDEDDQEQKDPPKVSPSNDTDQVTMRELVYALSTFGASNQQQVVMKTTVDKDLPKFGGDPSDWVQFKSEFVRTSKKYHFDDSENMIRLRKALVGQAKTTVQHLMANVVNVNVIVDSLEKRFGRPRVVLNALATRAKACVNVTTSKPETIIDFGLAVQALVSNILSYEETGYLHSVELLENLVKKLSPDLQTRWFEWLAADVQRQDNLMGFSEWTSTQLDIAYQRVDVKYGDSSSQEERPERRRTRGSGSFHVLNGEEAKCPSCQKTGHILSKCWSFAKKNLDDRWNIVKSTKACISCLNVGHRASKCDNGKKCDVAGCNSNHHRLLHYEKKDNSAGKQRFENRRNSPEPAAPAQEDQGNVHLEGNMAVISGCDGPLPIVPVKLRGPNGTITCHALMDSGATRSLIRKDIADKLGLQGEKLDYSYRGVTGEIVTEKDATRFNCDISGRLRGSSFKTLRGAITVKDIKTNPYSIDMEAVKQKWPHLKGVAARSLTKIVPELIVGNNNPHLILPKKILRGKEEDPIGWRTEPGWTVSGNFDGIGRGTINVLYGEVISNEYLHNIIKQSFSFDDFGVKVPKMKGRNLDEKRAYKILESTTRKVENGWETGLLWCQDEIIFPESETAALKRLEYTDRKMRDPLYKQLYQDKIKEYLDKVYLRKLTSEEAANRSNTTYIIPHFGHTNPNKPGKFRFILDAKSKTHGVSLNDMLLKGPDLIRPLVAVHWRFRIHRIALTGDIADMFHRIKIRKEDSDSQRILWRDGDSRKAADHYVMDVMIFGSKSSPASAIFVKDKNAETFRDKYPAAVEVIITDHYVDDCCTGGNSVEEVIQLRQQLTEIMEAGSFNLCKWMSNSKEVLETIPVELRAEGAKSFQTKEEFPGERVLGMMWDPVEDMYRFSLGFHKVKPSVLNGDVPTKREMCGLIMSLFDPIGFIAHYRIKGMILLQRVWSAGIGWDDQIPMEIFEQWRKWLDRLSDLKQVNVPRCYSQNLSCSKDIQLHTLCDGSSEAFGCVCYLRISFQGKVTIAFVGAKANVAPLKKTTIPRLELQAALMGSRLAHAFLEETKIKISKRYFWTDSSTVMQWLRSRTGNLKEFVANRIGEMQESTDLSEWHWLPTHLNTADILTRLESEISFSPSCEFYNGPQFLYGSSTDWNFAEERRRTNEEEKGAITTLTAIMNSQDADIGTGFVPDPERFSNYNRLVRATAAVIRATRYWVSRMRKDSVVKAPWQLIPNESRDPWTKRKYYSLLTVDDRREAVHRIIQLVQREAFGDEFNTIRDGGQPGKKGKIWRLSPIMGGDGLIRVDGRIGAANVAGDAKFPIILPPRHHVTELIVDRAHVKNGHQGVEAVLANLRQQFWIIDGRHVVKRSWTRCGVCHLAKCKPVIPKMGNLPDFRLASHQSPFSYCGIDLFGPMEVTVGRHHEKRWGVLFCCMVVRAVHLEVVHSLSTDELMMALSRFVDVRGRPSVIFSDNGTNFVGASRELREQWKQIDFQKIQECGEMQRIKWVFNPPAAPHIGGVWERMIQTVKKCLKSVLVENYPRDTTLLTLMKAVENIVNSRPLTHVSDDLHDAEAITPNHLLRGGCGAGPAIPALTDTSDQFLRVQWKRSQVLAERFWQRWTKEFLPRLIRRGRWLDSSPPLELGTLVFLVDDQRPRNCWLRGFISAVYPGKDGQVRVVDVTIRDQRTRSISVFRRPVAKVCPLGLRMKIGQPEVANFGGQNVNA